MKLAHILNVPIILHIRPDLYSGNKQQWEENQLSMIDGAEKPYEEADKKISLTQWYRVQTKHVEMHWIFHVQHWKKKKAAVCFQD